MANWTIKGEAGAGLDATERSLHSLGIDAATLEFGSLAADQFTFTMRTSTPAGAGLDGVNRIPALGQKIELFKDGERKFTGHAVSPEVDLDRVVVTAMGPWEWMSTIPVSEVKAGARDTDTTGERPAYAFPQQGLRDSLRALNNAARSAGVPVKFISDEEVGDHISSMFTCLKTTVAAKSWADALADLMAWCVDAVAWYDHSGTGNAQFKVTRRSAMTPLTLTIGTDNITECKIRPRLDLEVKRTELHYVKRNPTTGLPRWARQAHGTAEAGKVQMVAVSGPDVSVLVPKDDFEKATLQTEQVRLSMAWALAHDQVLKDLVAKYGRPPGTQGAGDLIPSAYRLKSGVILDWLRKERGIQTREVRVTGWITSTESATGGYGAVGTELKKLGRLKHYPLQDYYEIFVDYTVEVINKTYPTKTTFYKKWDYEFLEPPDGLAQELRDAQNWVPWEGRITTVGDEVSGDNVLGRKIRLSGSLPVCATMDALLKRVSYDLMGGRTTYTLGAPARTDFGSMIKRIQRQPADNIVYIP